MSGIGTKCVQAGYTPGSGEPRQVPIIQKTFKFRQTEWKHILETVCFYAIYSRLEKTGNIPEDLRNSPSEFLF